MSPLIDKTRSTPRRLLLGGGVLALALGLLTACGSDSASSAGPATTSESSQASASGSATAQAQSLDVTAENFRFSLDKQNLSAGAYTIQVVNKGTATHDLVVERNGQEVARSEKLAPGASGTVPVTLEPGQYVFYCSIGNHRAMGMELTVPVS